MPESLSLFIKGFRIFCPIVEVDRIVEDVNYT